MFEEEKEVVIDDNGVHVNSKNYKKRNKLANKISAVTPLIAVVAFLVLGFCFDAWHPGWIVFLAIPIIEILINITEKHGRAKFVSSALIVSTIAYLVLGFCFNAWHPGWLVFFLVPITAVLSDN